jgi:hypothetical protein
MTGLLYLAYDYFYFWLIAYCFSFMNAKTETRENSPDGSGNPLDKPQRF